MIFYYLPGICYYGEKFMKVILTLFIKKLLI